MTLFSVTSSSDVAEPTPGSKDGRGCADNDRPFVFGRRPRSVAPFPFPSRQYARLLALRGRIGDGRTCADDVDSDGVRPPSAARAAGAPTHSLCYSCLSCGAMVPGAFQGEQRLLCPRCQQVDARDSVAWLILATAGVLDPH